MTTMSESRMECDFGIFAVRVQAMANESAVEGMVKRIYDGNVDL
jgi:hypothetical protein